MTRAEELVDAALYYAQRGWYVFPCKLNKAPYTRRGFHDATIDGGQIVDWWREWPEASIGIATGARSGWLVLDIDPRHGGEESLAALVHKHGALPSTVEALTGGGGRHIGLRHPGFIIPCSVNQVGEGLDIRADGGYIIAPPSNHPSGQRYEWELSSHPDDTPFADIPNWLLSLIRTAPAKARTALGEIPDVIPENTRNETLFKIGASMRDRGLPVHAIAAALQSMNTEQCQPPLDASEVETIAQSTGRYKKGEPKPADVIAGAPDEPTDDENMFIQAALSSLFGGLTIRRIIQQGVSEAHYSIELNAGNGLVPLGNGRQFLDQQTWRTLLLAHGAPPFARLKETSWYRTVLQLQALVTIEDAEIGTAQWLRDVLLMYQAQNAQPWISEGENDSTYLKNNAPFTREGRLYVHTGGLTQYIAIRRLGSPPAGAIHAALRALDFQRVQVTAKDDLRTIRRHYWTGILDD